MHLLLTTSQSFLLLDTDSGEYHPLDRGRGLYYGMARNGDKIYIAARKRLVSSEIPQLDERGEILIFDDRLKPCGRLCAPFPLRDMHEIAWHGGKLWATCSFDNMVALFDGERWEQWYPLGTEPDGPRDANHFNSFMFDLDQVWILAHNRGASELLAFSLRTRALVERVELGNCGHNIWREDGQIFTCSSGSGKLLGDRGFMLETGGFPRGVAFNGGVRCVGISALAERKARDFTSGKLMLFDRDWKLRNEIQLPGEGLVLDMLPLPDGFGDEIGRGRRLTPSMLERVIRKIEIFLKNDKTKQSPD
jgi:hypothetical protein